MAGGVGAIEERVILVDADDVVVGSEEKLRAHETGVLHRAFSVFVVDDRGRVLLQRRAPGKYHSAGLWSNTCCGHPRPGEDVAAAAARRLREEMGISCDLSARGRFQYRADLGNGLVEHELDHLFVGRFTGDPTPDLSEASEWAWVPWTEVEADTARRPERFSAWLPHALGAMGGPPRN